MHQTLIDGGRASIHLDIKVRAAILNILNKTTNNMVIKMKAIKVLHDPRSSNATEGRREQVWKDVARASGKVPVIDRNFDTTFGEGLDEYTKYAVSHRSFE